MEIETVIRMIRDLTAKAVHRGCTEAEAMAAADKVDELLRVYDLSIDQVFLGEAKCVRDHVGFGSTKRGYQNDYMWAVGDFCGCKMWTSRKEGYKKVYNFFGLEPDVQMAMYLCDIIAAAVKHETEQYQKSLEYNELLAEESHGLSAAGRRGRARNLLGSFRRGMAYRIGRRLHDMADLRQKDEAQPLAVPVTSDGTSLMVIKENKIKDEFEKLGLKLTQNKGYTYRVHVNAYDAGDAAGNRVNLHRPLSGTCAGLLK